MAKQPLDRNAVLDYHTRVQGFANAVADMLSKAISEQDVALLAMLQTELRPVRELILRNQNPLQSYKKISDRLESIQKQITEIQHRGIHDAAKILYEKAEKLARNTSRYTAQEIDAILKK